jgi:antitoxin component YwqK of YwqJK toxin-antitoxin module
MIKYISSTGIGVLIYTIAIAQHVSASAEGIEINNSENNAIVVTTSSINKNKYNLPESGNLKAYTDEALLYSGTVKGRRLHGKWQSWYSNNQLCDSGTFVKGIPQGEWKYWDSKGQLRAIRHYNAGKLTRIKEEMSRSNPKNTLYPITVLYKKNRKQGEVYLKAGYSFDFTVYHPQRISLKQAVENNINEEEGYRPVFDECLHHGLYMNYYANGLVKDSGYYKNGLRDGLWLQRNTADNSYLTGTYKNGAKHGEWKEYNAAGRLMTFFFYNKGEEQWRKKMKD